MTIPSMSKLSTVFPIMIEKYEQFIPNIEGMGVPDKINAIIQYLNRIGKLSNDVVADWNKVMVWVMDEGLNDSVIAKVDDLISKGTFDDLLNGMFDDINTANTNFQTGVNSSLSDIVTNLKNYDVFADVNKTVLDGVKITTILNANNGKTFYVPDGVYSLNGTITITNDVSLLLSANAIIQASVIMSDMIVYNNGSTNGGKNRFIKGGILDGNGLANNCIRIPLCAHLELTSIVIKNPINRGLKIDGGYEVIADKLFFNNTITTNITDNISIEMNTSDSYFTNIVATNYTVGIKITSGGNFIDNFHVWGNQSGRLPSTIGIDNKALGNVFERVYFDTCSIGFQTDHRTNLVNCNFIIARSYRQYFTVQPIYINSTIADYVNIEKCYFEFTNQGTETYHVTVVSGQTSYVIFSDCDFPTPTTLDNVPLNARKPKVTKLQITFSGFATANTNAYTEKTATITDTKYPVKISDSVIFNVRGLWEIGLIPQVSMIADNQVRVRLYNPTASPITPADRIVYLTVIQKATVNSDTLDISIPTVTIA